MPRRWTLVLRDRADTARPIRPEDCHGLLNRWWPHPASEHAAPKRWAMNGWPRPLGDRLHHWTLTWLDDENPAPLDPGELVGVAQRVGDHVLEPLSVTRTFDTPYTEMLTAERGPVAVRAADVRTWTPVVMTTRDTTGERIPHIWPSPRRLFGAVHRSGGGIVGGSGAVGAVARFAPPALAAPWLEEALTGLAQVRRSALPGQEVRLAEHHHAESRTVLGWRGGLRLETLGGHRSPDTFAALLQLLELAGVGKYTAQGFGSVRVDTVTHRRSAEEVPAPRPGRTAHRVRRNPPRTVGTRAHAVAEAEEFGGTLFD
ncbi:CRISPR system precrRNA processing endoribonuclease RAMP protein Cas6 [Nocardiopsis ganjiahuensis]|uniref:CRISPR system precrRNA processing endoribonuclease RAMP protein Cas6 n=1 Tax=Nocardiopsis ganjiahuensis TaxID=239984 RepID=UPI000344B261|nr:CRISPR system precrRNA processing endoribonuclease RAMP protein Cas6 [Nocardiopsis ganjiahuensis]